MIRIIIADDHAIVRQGLKNLTSSVDDLSVVGEAQNGADLMDVLRDTEADVVILDLSMPGRNGLETLKDIKRLYPHLPVLVLSMHPEDQYAVRAVRAGAAGYMNKESAGDDLVTAVRKVMQGSKYISPVVAELLASFVESGNTDDAHKSLSDREYEVFISLANGMTVSQIADELNLSIKTISTYRTRILEKMRMTTNADLTRHAVNHELLKHS